MVAYIEIYKANRVISVKAKFKLIIHIFSFIDRSVFKIRKICEYCKKEFETKDKRKKYCNRQCSSNARKKRVKVICSYCKKEFELQPSLVHKNNYCSKECKYKHSKETMVGKNNPNYSKIETICDYCGKTIYIKKSIYENQKHHYCSKECCNNDKKNYDYSYMKTGKYIKCEICGKEIWVHKYELDNLKHHYCSTTCAKIGQSKYYSGENSPNYNPNISQEDREDRRNINGYKEFIHNCMERDNYTCQCCGDNRGNNLNVHHLNGYNWDKEHRTDINNGVTLCEKCHKDFHKLYGYKNNTKEQFEDFLNKKDDKSA